MNLGSWTSSPGQSAPSWDVLKRAAIWTREEESIAFLKAPVVEAHQMASEEGTVAVTEVELVTGSVQTVTVYDARVAGVPAGVKSMSVRAGIAMVTSNQEFPHLSNLIVEHVPVLLWGLEADVARLLDANDLDSAGSRLVNMRLYLRARIAGLGHGMRFRELSMAILGDAGSLQPQVHPFPC